MSQNSLINKTLAYLVEQNKELIEKPFENGEFWKSIQMKNAKEILRKLDEHFKTNSFRYAALKASYDAVPTSSATLNRMLKQIATLSTREELLTLLQDAPYNGFIDISLDKCVYTNLTKEYVDVRQGSNTTLARTYYQNLPKSYGRYLDKIDRYLKSKDIHYQNYSETIVNYQKNLIKTLIDQNLYHDVTLLKRVQKNSFLVIDKILIGEQILTHDPVALAHIDNFLNTAALNDLKLIISHLLILRFKYASLKLANAYDKTLGLELTGIIRDRTNPMIVASQYGLLPELRSLAQTYFGNEVELRTRTVFDKIIAILKLRIQQSSYSTRFTRILLKKLQTLKFRMYTHDFNPSTRIKTLSSTNYLGNLLKIIRDKAKINKKFIGKKHTPFEPTLETWTVNACYNPLLNQISIPAMEVLSTGLDLTAPLEDWYAKIGFIIAHEVCHSIDPNCLRYNQKGLIANIEEYPKDLETYYDRCKQITSFFKADLDQTRILNTEGEDVADYEGHRIIEAALKEENLRLEYYFKIFATAHYIELTNARKNVLKNTDCHSDWNTRLAKALISYSQFPIIKQEDVDPQLPNSLFK